MLESLRKALACLVICAFTGALAQELNYYRGEIGGEPWQLELGIADGAVRGRLTHDRQPVQIEMGGTYSEADNSIVMRFFEPGDEFSGTMVGEPDPLGVFKGNVLSTGGLTPFSFEQVARYVDFSFKQGAIQATSTYPFFTASRLANMNEYVQPDLMAEQLEFVQMAQEADLDDLVRHGWWFDSHARVEYAAPGLLSSLVTVSYYTGGAHPNTHYWAYNLAYSGTRLRPFELGDLFTEGSDFLDLLNASILDSLLEQNADWVVNGSVAELSEAELQVFTLSPLGLQFVFAPYAVGPYSSGTYTALVPMSELEELLDPTGPAATLLPETAGD